jgi:hypothetical protein
VDHVFTPLLSKDENLLDLHQWYDPQDPEQQIRDCVVMRVYCSSMDAKTGDKFSHLLGCSTLDLAQLMQHSINVSSNKVESVLTSTSPEANDCTFALRTNFCNTFVLCAVLPIFGEVRILPTASKDGNPQNHHLGLSIEQSANLGEVMKALKEVEAMQRELQALQEGLALPYPNNSHSCYAPSALRNLPNLQTVVRTQQALQQAYCLHGVQTSNAVLTEPNGLSYASGATCLQLHQASVCFSNMSAINRMRVAPVPRDQIMVQFFAAMVTTGLTPKHLMQMKAETHQDEILEFLKAAVSAGEMDQASLPSTQSTHVHCFARADSWLLGCLNTGAGPLQQRHRALLRRPCSLAHCAGQPAACAWRDRVCTRVPQLLLQAASHCVVAGQQAACPMVQVSVWHRMLASSQGRSRREALLRFFACRPVLLQVQHGPQRGHSAAAHRLQLAHPAGQGRLRKLLSGADVAHPRYPEAAKGRSPEPQRQAARLSEQGALQPAGARDSD